MCVQENDHITLGGNGAVAPGSDKAFAFGISNKFHFAVESLDVVFEFGFEVL